MTWRWVVVTRLCQKHGLKRGAEIGVAEGRFTKGLLSAIPDLHLIAVDYWPEGYPTWDGGRWSREHQDENRAKFLAVKDTFPDRLTLLELPSVEAAMKVPDASLDFVFIDAGHSYEECSADIAAWIPKVKPGGLVTGHDYNRHKFPGVIRAVDEAFPEIQRFEDYVWTAQI